MASTRPRRAYSNSKEFFRIDGEAVQFVTETVNRVVKLGDFITTISTQSGLLTPVLPNGCRLYRKRQNSTIFVIERPPQVKQLNWTGMHTDREKVRWRLAFPYTVFIIPFENDAINSSSCKVFYNITPIQNMNDVLLRSNLCNVGRTGVICTGDMRVTGDSMTQKAENFIAQFWQTTFNPDLATENFIPLSGIIPQVATLERWQDETTANSLFPLTVKWPEQTRLSTVIGEV